MGYHETMMYSPASQRMHKLMMGEVESRRQIYPILMAHLTTSEVGRKRNSCDEKVNHVAQPDLMI